MVKKPVRSKRNSLSKQTTKRQKYDGDKIKTFEDLMSKMNMSGMAPACFATDQALNQYLSNTTNVSFTGHSLGGALAEYITWRTGQDDANPSDGIGAQSVTFNAPGIATYAYKKILSMVQTSQRKVAVISEQLRNGGVSYGY